MKLNKNCKLKDSKNCANGLNSKKGFTLIELLVAVIIVGLLVAICLPQYQKSVARVELAEVITNLKALKQAEERYYMIHDAYTNNLKDLDMEIANNGNIRCKAGGSHYIHCYNKNFSMASYNYLGNEHQNWTECRTRNKTLASACVDFLGCKEVEKSYTQHISSLGVPETYGCANNNFPF